LLLGEPGAGKTFTLYRYAYKSLEERLDTPSGAPLPIYLICSTWQEGQTLIQWIHHQWESLQSLRESDLQNTLLLLDGFDELGTSRIRKVTDKDGNERDESYDPRPLFLKIIPKDGRVLLSCRIKEYEDFGTKVDLNGAVTLRPLTETQIHEYLADLPDLWDALSSDAELLEVMKTPLLLSLFAFGYKDAPDDARALRDLNAAQLSEAIFKQYVQKRYEHEALRLEDMGQTPPFTLEEVYDVLGQVAMVNASGGYDVQDNVLTHVDFEIALQDKARVNAFTEFARDINLITPIENAFRFIHLRLRDYFVRTYCYPRVGDETLYDLFRSPASALASLPDAEALNVLLEEINHSNTVVRAKVIEALGKIRDARAVEPLIAVLKHETEFTRRRAADALARIGTPAVEPLIAALKDADWDVRHSAVWALGEIGDTRAVEPLITALKDVAADWTVRGRVAEALGVIGDLRAVEPLIAALKDTDEEVRGSAAWALGKIRDARAVEPLIAALEDGDEYVVTFVAWALANIGDTRAIEPLIAALKDADAGAINITENMLNNDEDSRYVNFLDSIRERYRMIRDAAQHALESIGTPEALAALEDWRKRQYGE